MKIKTLEMIHELLKEYETETAELYRQAADVDEKYAESNGTTVKDGDITVRYRADHLKALDALNDFEAQEF